MKRVVLLRQFARLLMLVEMEEYRSLQGKLGVWIQFITVVILRQIQPGCRIVARAKLVITQPDAVMLLKLLLAVLLWNYQVMVVVITATMLLVVLGFDLEARRKMLVVKKAELLIMFQLNKNTMWIYLAVMEIGE
jgi:hypothetical protein